MEIKSRRFRKQKQTIMSKEETKKNGLGLIDINGAISPQPIGNSYKLIPGQVYIIDMESQGTDSWGDRKVEAVLRETGPLKLPDRIINSKQTEEFIERAVASHRLSKSPTTGIMLTGLKGSGKTVDANQIAVRSGLPIVQMGKDINLGQVYKFFKQIEGADICILMDECDKRGNQMSGLYDLLDGVEQGFRKMFIATANIVKELDRNLMNRPGRILFFRKYEEISKHFKKAITRFEGIDDPDNVLSEFIENHFDIESMDIIKSFAEQVRIFAKPGFTTKDLYQLVKPMNIELKGSNKFRDIIHQEKTSNQHLDALLELIEDAQLTDRQKNELSGKLDVIRERFSDMGMASICLGEDENPYSDYEDDDDYDDDYDYDED